MKLVFIGKWFPFVGGETTKAYFMIRELSRHHKIDVISCGWDALSTERCKISVKDLDKLQPPNGRFYSSPPFERLRTIPSYNPLTEKLVSIFLDLSEQEKIDGIISWYFMPFGVAALICKRLTNVKYVFQHAGSDVYRIFLRSRVLQPILLEVIRNSDGLLVYPAGLNIFNTLYFGKIFVSKHAYLLDPDFYLVPKKKAQTMIEDYFSEDQLRKLEKKLTAGEGIVFRPGKLNKHTGVIETIEIAKKMKDTLFIIVGNGKLAEFVRKKEKILKNLIYIEAVPLWIMPAFYSISSLILHIEVDFPIKAHGSIVPVESFLAGKLVVTNVEVPEELKESIIRCNQHVKDIYAAINSGLKIESLTDRKFNDEKIKQFKVKRKEYITALSKYIDEVFRC